jgi:hypothetical protein
VIQMAMYAQLQASQHLLRLQKQWTTAPNAWHLWYTNCMGTDLCTLFEHKTLKTILLEILDIQSKNICHLRISLFLKKSAILFFLAKIVLDYNDANLISTKKKAWSTTTNNWVHWMQRASSSSTITCLCLILWISIIKLEVEFVLDYMLMVKVLVLLGIIQLNYLNI